MKDHFIEYVGGLCTAFLLGILTCYYFASADVQAQGYFESREALRGTGQVDVWAGSARENRLMLQQEQFLQNQLNQRPCR